jgi:DNA-binding transcriptional LysR family regulator
LPADVLRLGLTFNRSGFVQKRCMDRLDQYRVFSRVAEMGSFIKAAHALELPRASVSAAVQQLETSLGARLLHRTTRQVRLTADGVQLLERVRLILVDAEEIDQLFLAAQRKISGRRHVDEPSRVIVNNAESNVACCVSGIGLIQVPRFDASTCSIEANRWRSCPHFARHPCRCRWSIRTAGSACVASTRSSNGLTP